MTEQNEKDLARFREEPVRCGHEAYQGFCCHCGVPIINGVAKVPALASPQLQSSEAVERVAELESDLKMLHLACQEGDPHRELVIRVEDALALLRSITAPFTALRTQKDIDQVE